MELVNYSQECGGTIFNTRSALTAAHCTIGDAANRWRIRIGSNFANSGGVVHNTLSILNHPSYDDNNTDNDIALIRTASVMVHNNLARPAYIPGINYNLADNQVVWAAGGGHTSQTGTLSEQLHHVQIFTVNQLVCMQRYSTVSETITNNMLCSGLLDVSGRDQCQGDYGGPLYHNNVVVGVCSWGHGCAQAFFPGVNTRVSRYTSWIQANA